MTIKTYKTQDIRMIPIMNYTVLESVRTSILSLHFFFK